MAVNIVGPSTTQTSYLIPTTDSVNFVSVLSAGDQVSGSVQANGNPWRFVGVPDGIGAYDNNDGTMTVLINHEIGNTSGTVRAHGATGAFVDRLVINKTTLQVQSASDLGRSFLLFDPATGTYVPGTPAVTRLCSSDLPAVSAFYDAATGLGTQARIYMTGEESGVEGRAFGFVATGVDSGKVYELPRLGKFSWENSVANPGSGAKTVVMGQDDATPGQVYIYVGDKQATGTEIEKAGLTNGKLYGIRVPAFAVETNALAVAAAGTAFVLQEIGPNGDASRMTGAQIQTESTAEGVTEFLRPEDGAWDPTNPNRYYFATTNAATSPSRLWALDFTDATRPELGGTVKMLLEGFEGQVMMDNITVGNDGRVYIVEDVGNNARLGKVLQYDPRTDTLTSLAEHDPSRFSGLTLPFTQDEEASGILDVTSILGAPGKQAFLIDVQAHYAFGQTEIVEGGQLQVMYIDRSIQGTSVGDTLSGSRIDDLIVGREGNDTLNGGTGTNVLFGGAGDDAAVYDFRLANANATVYAGKTAVTITGTTTAVAGIERHQFQDGTVVTNDGAPLVDDLFYDLRNKDVFAAGVDADAHYAASGFREGRDPNAFFSTTGYLAVYGDVRAAGVNPLAHYDANGWKEGRDTSVNFDTGLYLARNADVRASGMDPLLHYLTSGQEEGRTAYTAIGEGADIAARSGFDAEYYLLANNDIARAAISAGGDSFAFALNHFNAIGWREGRDPNAVFDTKGYLSAYEDVARAGINPLMHYEAFGWKEGRDPSANFDTKAYLAANADVRAAGLNPLTHYLASGIYENRLPMADGKFS